MEIEHKFLVNDTGFLADATTSFRISQGYLSESSPTLRIRIAGQRAFLTVKSPSIDGGLSRMNGSMRSRCKKPGRCSHYAKGTLSKRPGTLYRIKIKRGR
ncbi:CYTH domain-containing protein [Porphyromonas macacae]|uniref:CYTH domain-containing protein n=1 Tax=Porphyromonas macacae TaxID=28115 RepID=UPI0034E57606